MVQSCQTEFCQSKAVSRICPKQVSHNCCIFSISQVIILFCRYHANLGLIRSPTWKANHIILSIHPRCLKKLNNYGLIRMAVLSISLPYMHASPYRLHVKCNTWWQLASSLGSPPHLGFVCAIFYNKIAPIIK